MCVSMRPYVSNDLNIEETNKDSHGKRCESAKSTTSGNLSSLLFRGLQIKQFVEAHSTKAEILYAILVGQLIILYMLFYH